MNKDAHNIKARLPYWAKRKFFCDSCKKEHGFRVNQNKTLDGKHLCDRQYYKYVLNPTKPERR